MEAFETQFHKTVSKKPNRISYLSGIGRRLSYMETITVWA